MSIYWITLYDFIEPRMMLEIKNNKIWICNDRI